MMPSEGGEARCACEGEMAKDRAIHEAAAVLDGFDRDPRRAAYIASLWLRTAFRTDHPNYLTPEQVVGLSVAASPGSDTAESRVCTCSGGGQAPGRPHIKGEWMHCVYRPRWSA